MTDTSNQYPRARGSASSAAGDQFGRLTLLERDTETTKRGTYWWCLCKCGVKKSIWLADLRRDRTTSCGCWARERPTTHGALSNGKRSPEWISWKNAKARTTNPKHNSYPDYGGRGIMMAPEFAASFEAFLTEVGTKPSPKHTIERKNNERGYVPGNLCWATHTDQMRNRRTTKLTVKDAEDILALKSTEPQKITAERYGICQQLVSRIQGRKGWL